MVDPRWPGEHTLEALSAALKAVPVDTERAWGRVRARVWGRAAMGMGLQRRAYRSAAPRWPAAASLSVVAAFLALAQFRAMGTLAQPALAAEQAPAPRTALVTPSAGRDTGAARLGATTLPQRVQTPTPVPVPPGQS
jgi:hypothetical protein